VQPSSAPLHLDGLGQVGQSTNPASRLAFALEQVRQTGAAGKSGRRLAEQLSGLARPTVDQLRPFHAELKRWTAEGRLVFDGLRYRLPEDA
jgi:hypothetical protein